MLASVRPDSVRRWPLWLCCAALAIFLSLSGSLAARAEEPELETVEEFVCESNVDYNKLFKKD